MYIIVKKTLLLFAGITLFISCKSGQNQSSKNSSELNDLVSVSKTTLGTTKGGYHLIKIKE